MSTKDKPEPRTGHTGPLENTSDQSWQKHFPTAAEANAARQLYQEGADKRRDDAVRAANMDASQRQRMEDAATRNAQPIPTGEGENPHEDEPELEKHSDDALAQKKGKQ